MASPLTIKCWWQRRTEKGHLEESQKHGDRFDRSRRDAAKSYHSYCLSAFIHIHNRIHSLNSSRIKSVRLNEALPLRLNELLKHPLQLILLHLPQAPLSLLTSLDKTDGMKDSGQSKQHNSRGFIRSWGSNPPYPPTKQSKPANKDGSGCCWTIW